MLPIYTVQVPLNFYGTNVFEGKEYSHHILLHMCICNICHFKLLVCCAHVTDLNATYSWETRYFNCSIRGAGRASVMLDLKEIKLETSLLYCPLYITKFQNCPVFTAEIHELFTTKDCITMHALIQHQLWEHVYRNVRYAAKTNKSTWRFLQCKPSCIPSWSENWKMWVQQKRFY
jgi:hypothetical protein